MQQHWRQIYLQFVSETGCHLHVSSLFVKQAPGLHLNRVWYFFFFLSLIFRFRK